MSWMVLFRTWPMWRMPVTFGGGMTMENAGFGEFGFATNSRFSIQKRYHFASTACGSEPIDNSGMPLRSPPQKILHGGHERLQTGFQDIFPSAERAPFLLAARTFPS